jgi:hypothetical protein
MYKEACQPGMDRLLIAFVIIFKNPTGSGSHLSPQRWISAGNSQQRL